MRKRIVLLVLTAAFFLSGCVGTQSGREIYTVYCAADLERSRGGDAVYALEVQADGENEERVASDLLRQMIAASGDSYQSPLPAGTQIRRVQIENGLATVDLSGEYARLSGMELTLADACIALTLCQLSGVERVSVLAEGESLPYREEQTLASSEVLLSQRDDEVRIVRAYLFFLDPETGELRSESRRLQLYEGQTKAEAILEALLHGPEDRELRAVLPDGVQVLSSRVEEGICYVNLSGEFLKTVPDSLQAQENIVYSIVRSLCSVSEIQAVQFSVEGETVSHYGGVDLSVPLS